MSRAKQIFCVVVYDVRSNKTRTKVSHLLEQYGERINKSVFECMFSESQLNTIQEEIVKLINPKYDAVAYYPICMNCYAKAKYHPEKKAIRSIVRML